MSNWFDVSDRDKKRAYEQVAAERNLPAYAVEKDWWVVQALGVLFEMEIGRAMVFKGGTSLSKAWGLIERFSEDIDLAVDRKFYGFEGDLGKKQRTMLRKKANAYITERLYPELASGFRARGVQVELGLEAVTTTDQDPITLSVIYPNVIPSPGYLKPRIQVEFSCRSLIEPFTLRPIRSMLDEKWPAAPFAEPSVNIPTVDPERTLLEKIFLLHEEFQRTDVKVRVDRMSRHLYDIYKLVGSPFAESVLTKRELYAEIVAHRKMFYKFGGVDYRLHNPQTIHPLPPDHLIDSWRRDYLTMKEQMIYAGAPGFDEMMDQIGLFIKKINALDWKVTS